MERPPPSLQEPTPLLGNLSVALTRGWWALDHGAHLDPGPAQPPLSRPPAPAPVTWRPDHLPCASPQSEVSGRRKPALRSRLNPDRPLWRRTGCPLLLPEQTLPRGTPQSALGDPASSGRSCGVPGRGRRRAGLISRPRRQAAAVRTEAPRPDGRPAPTAGPRVLNTKAVPAATATGKTTPTASKVCAPFDV